MRVGEGCTGSWSEVKPSDSTRRAEAKATIKQGDAMRRYQLCLLPFVLLACQHQTRDQRPGGNGDSDAQPPGPPPSNCENGVPADLVTDGKPPEVVKAACDDTTTCDPWSPGYTPSAEVLSAVQLLVGSMSLADKTEQMRGTNPGGGSNYSDIFRTPDNAQKGIKGFLFRDGPNGVNLAAQLPSGKNGYSTAFPVPMARAATFDLELEHRIGEAMGDETLASGNTLLLAPAVNVLRHPAWGRAQEVYGEDPYIQGRMGTAFVSGVQSYVPACVKHYAANNIENGRASLNSQMDEQTLREMYTRHFEMIIRDGGVSCVMAAYNQVNGKKSTQSAHLLDDLLRGDFGFRGFVMSDWWAMPPGTAGASTDSLQANASEAINAGLDMELPWAYNYQQLEAVTGSGRPVAESVITQAATRILEQKYRFQVARMGERSGLRPPTTTLSSLGSIENNQAHIALAHQAALEAMVLLKNDGGTLPIDRGRVRSIAVLGAEIPYHVVYTDRADGVIRFATDVRLGDLGSGRVFPDPAKSSGPAGGIQELAGNGITVTSGSSASLADQADFVVVVAGLTPQDEGEEYTGAGDRPNFALDGKSGSGKQDALITAVAAKGKPMVVVLEGGSVIDMPWLDKVPAVVMAWYPGMDGGRALGKLLFGDVAFSGKLPITWPKSWADLPVFNAGTTTSMSYYLGYRHFDHERIAPLFPFGHGLSTTRFAYDHLVVPCTDAARDAVVLVTADITNTSAVPGDEVAFLFVAFPSSPARHPVKEVKSFRRVFLEPGQTKRVVFPLRLWDLKTWDDTSQSWRIESGPVSILVGPNAADLPLTDTLMVR
jgi:beta-glucosidase